MTAEEYRRYQTTPHWQALKAWAVQRAGGRCQGETPTGGRCENAVGLQLHHKSYERLWNEHPDDVCVLCDRCHAITHLMAVLCRWCDDPVYPCYEDAAAGYDADPRCAVANASRTCQACDHMMNKEG
jgi:hypothetical protein